MLAIAFGKKELFRSVSVNAKFVQAFKIVFFKDVS